jgi:heme o synthase
MKRMNPGNSEGVMVDVSAPVEAASGPAWQNKLADFYQLTKPRMNFLIVTTTFVGFFVAARMGQVGWVNLLLVMTLLGTALTAASASVFNQVIEREYDARMPRTRKRPVAAGRLGVFESVVFATVLGIAGVSILAWQVNLLTALLGLSTLALYALVYTPLKRHSPWCTLVGAVPGAIPPMMGVTAIDNAVTPLAWSLFAILAVWQMPHFFALAFMYKNDYAAGGFRMLPNCVDGDRRTRLQIILFSLLLIPVSLSPIVASNARWIFAVAALVLSVWFFTRAWACRKPAEGVVNERKLFFASLLFLPLILAALMVDQ